jgi:hypothetical protein
MKERWMILTAVLLMLFLGITCSQNAQEAPAQPDKLARQGTAVGLLRTINTAEIVDLSTYGSFSSWEILVSHNQQYFDDFAARKVNRQQIPDSKFGEPPEILPGWSLRLNVHTDGQGYDLMLQDTTDKKCPSALFTNEAAVIWESKPIGCD